MYFNVSQSNEARRDGEPLFFLTEVVLLSAQCVLDCVTYFVDAACQNTTVNQKVTWGF